MFTFIPPALVFTYHRTLSPKAFIYYPHIAGIKDQSVQQRINERIVQKINRLIHQQGFSQDPERTEVNGWFAVKTNQLGILSLSIYNYTYFYQAAHGLTVSKSLTCNTETGQFYKLKDLFNPGSNYVEKLSQLIKVQIAARDIPVLEPFTTIKPNQDFYIADKSLVVYFQAYEISPYVVGLPMFPISVFDLQDILNEEGPLARFATNS